MSSTSTQQSSSSSSTQPIQTPENDIMNQISSYAQGLASNMYQWAQGVFAQTSAITNEAVGNFFSVSQNMLGLSGNLTSQYNNLFAPENAQLVADANSYASPARMDVDMGMAGATQAQAGSAALANSEEQLRSYGIDPSAGRYAALDKAADVQNAANIAGAENTQRVSDIATGQALRSQAVQVGAQLPAAIANVNNTAIQANTGASNATLANANTGVNLMGLPNNYLQTAMGIKMPFSGSQGSSQSTGNSNSNKPQQPSSGNGSGSGAGAPGGGSSGPAWMPQHGGAGDASSVTGNPSVRGQPGSKTLNVPDQSQTGGGDDWNNESSALAGIYGEGGLGGVSDQDFTGGSGSMGVGQPGSSDADIFNNDQGTGIGQNPFNDGGFGQTLPSDQFGGSNGTFGGVGDGSSLPSGWGSPTYDPSANNMWGNSASDTSTDESGTYWSGNGSDVTGGQGPAWQDPDTTAAAVNTDWGSGADQYTGASSGGGDDSDGGDGGDYARGGPIPRHMPMRRLSSSHLAPSYAAGGSMPHAGTVPPSMSPSGGRQVDDVRAKGPGGMNLNLNADEFVIPRDVALWKGQEFFQKLIDQSRKLRMGAPAKPTQGAPAPAQNMR